MSIQSDLKWLKQNVTTKDDFKKAIDSVQKDIREVKESIDYLNDLSKRGFGSLLPWTDDIHKNSVQKDLPKRVKALEDIHPNSRHSPS